MKPHLEFQTELASVGYSQLPLQDGKPRPSSVVMVVLMSAIVAVVTFSAALPWIGSIWWTVLIAYAAQLSFVAMLGAGFFALHAIRQPEERHNIVRLEDRGDRLIDPEPPVWLSYQPKHEIFARPERVALSAASDRNSQKCCEWLSEYECEVHLCSDHDTLIGDIIAKPERWSLLIIDANHVGNLDAVSRELEYIRSARPKLPIIFLTGRQSKDRLSRLVSHDPSLVLAKPFFRKTLFTALEKLNLRSVGNTRGSF